MDGPTARRTFSTPGTANGTVGTDGPPPLAKNRALRYQVHPMPASPRTLRRASALAIATAAALALPAQARTCTWTGATDHLGATGTNWDCDGATGNGPPTGGDDLVYPAGAAHKADYEHNFAVPVPVFYNIDIGPGYTMVGSYELRFSNSLYVTAPFTGHTMIDGRDTGVLAVRESAPPGSVVSFIGTLTRLGGASSVGEGGSDDAVRVFVNGTGFGTPVPLTVYQGGRLSVTFPGQVQFSTLTVRPGGTLAVSDVPPGQLPPTNLGDGQVTGTLDLQSGAVLEYRVYSNGFNAGGIEMAAGSTAHLAGAVLRLVLDDPGAAPDPIGTERAFLYYAAPGTTINGTFAGLPEGATVEASNAPGIFYRISYGTPGDRNVRLTRVAAPPPGPQPAPGPAAPVPTLGHLALALLGALVGTAGLRARRQRAR